IVVGARGTPIHLNGERRIVCGTRDMLPVRTSYDAARSFAQHVRSTSARYAQADDHRHVALAEISRLLKTPRDQSRPAVFSAAFRSHAFAPVPAFATLRCSPLTVAIARARYDVELILATGPSGMALW